MATWVLRRDGEEAYLLGGHPVKLLPATATLTNVGAAILPLEDTADLASVHPTDGSAIAVLLRRIAPVTTSDSAVETMTPHPGHDEGLTDVIWGCYHMHRFVTFCLGSALYLK